MDVRERLRTPAGAAGPADPDQARQVFQRGRRRRVRRRALAASGTAAALLLAVVAWPGGLFDGDAPGSPVIEDVAGTPDPPEPDPPAPDVTELPPEGAADDSDEGSDEADATDDEASTAPPVDDDASTEDRAAEPAGSALVLADVRVGVHDGFDRVVLEFSGDGQPGWFTELGDRAIEHGKGREFDVAGGAVLTVFANMLLFPPDVPEGTPQWDAATITAPADAGVLTEVVSAQWYEGQHQLFLGLDEQVPYRIVRLDDPQRIVIDLMHPVG